MGQNKPLFLLVKVLPRPSDPFSLTSVASLPSGEGLSIDKHANKCIPTPHPRSDRVAGPWETVEQAWLRRLLRGRVHLVPSPGLPPEPQPQPGLRASSALPFCTVQWCVSPQPLLSSGIWMFPVLCLFPGGTGLCLPVTPGALDPLVSVESPSLPSRPRPVACLKAGLLSHVLLGQHSLTLE